MKSAQNQFFENLYPCSKSYQNSGDAGEGSQAKLHLHDVEKLRKNQCFYPLCSNNFTKPSDYLKIYVIFGAVKNKCLLFSAFCFNYHEQLVIQVKIEKLTMHKTCALYVYASFRISALLHLI